MQINPSQKKVDILLCLNYHTNIELRNLKLVRNGETWEWEINFLFYFIIVVVQFLKGHGVHQTTFEPI